MRTRSLIDGLKRLGLTEYEARAYVTLVEKGPLTANTLSKHSKIPYSKVYDVLSRLEEKGWIIIEGGKPKKYKPKSPREAIEITVRRIENEIKSISLQVINELQPLYERIGVQEKSDIVILRGKLMITEKAREMIEGAEREVEIVVPDETRDFHSFIEKALEKILMRGVEVKVLAGHKSMMHLGGNENPNLDVRLKRGMFGGGIIIDEREALILLGIKSGSIIAIWSNHKELVKLAKVYFNHLWVNADNIL